MSDLLDQSIENEKINISQTSSPIQFKKDMPTMETLTSQLEESNLLVNDIILKKYLTKLTEYEIVPLDDKLKQISDIRLFKINEMVYQSGEYSTYKFASVFNSVQNLNCGVFIIADSNGQKTNFYMGVRSLDDKRTTKSLKDTLKNALCGQFPGVKTEDLLDAEAETLLADIDASNIASVSCVAKNKDEDFTDNEKFIQGLEKLALAMQGQRYTAIVLAKSTSTEQLSEVRQAYENIYTHLSPFANLQLSYGTNTATNISDSFSRGTTSSTTHGTNHSIQNGFSHGKNRSTNKAVSKMSTKEMAIKSIGSALLNVASLVTAPLTGEKSLVAAGRIMAGQQALSFINPPTNSEGVSEGENYAENQAETLGETDSVSKGNNENQTETKGITSGTSDNMQLTMQNKTLINTLERIDSQLKRIDECESLGMWECATYFLSNSQETAEMAAGTYKSLMKGEKSGVETSAINYWGRTNKEQTFRLQEYLTNFIHPVFQYTSQTEKVPLTAATLISGNELAIHMGLPRKSVCGFPVIEHADFGKEVVQYNDPKHKNQFLIGNIFSMGQKTKTEVSLSRDSLTMHTFVTGSTGSGKSNTVYEMLYQLRNVYNIPFLVVEPAKGEYKNVFGQFPDVTVYGTNPKKYTNILRINPFRFPSDIHILEHLDRLVELFNVCWPLYAAMPAILKEAMEKAYVVAGWNLSTSENSRGELFPNFIDLLEQIETVIDESRYSSDSKGDYTGALCTRVRSLTTGLNRLIFTNNDLSDSDLFDKSAIIDLSRVGSTETKALIMGLLVMKLNEYRMTSGKINSPLSHITVLEEAHNLLKRTSTEQSTEGSNLIGKSVESLANSIAEMRTYGEGFIIADQSPGLLDMSVIRNTNTKIILRLPEQSDRELVGYAANLKKEQLEELSKLERGVAAIYQNDWIEPVLVQVNKCSLKEVFYCVSPESQLLNEAKLKKQLLFLLIQGRVTEKLDFDISYIDQGINSLNLSSHNLDIIGSQVLEYKKMSTLSLWDDKNFHKLSQLVTSLLDTKLEVEHCVTTATDNKKLTQMLRDIVLRVDQNLSETVIFAISQCFMKEMINRESQVELSEKIYCEWIDAIKKEEVL